MSYWKWGRLLHHNITSRAGVDKALFPDCRQACITVDKNQRKKINNNNSEKRLSHEITASGPSIFMIIKWQVWNLAAEYAKMRLWLIGGRIRHYFTLNTASCKNAKISAMLCRKLSTSAFAFCRLSTMKTLVDTSPNNTSPMYWLHFKTIEIIHLKNDRIQAKRRF